MRSAIFYTVFSVINLLGFLAGVLLLPAQVPIHFGAQLVADRLGSPWVYLAFPGATALVSGGIWAALNLKKNRAVTIGLLSAVGAILCTIGWAFFALVAGGVSLGERSDFPVVIVVGLPLSFLIAWLGICLPAIAPDRLFGVRLRASSESAEIRKRAYRMGGNCFLAAGLLSALSVLLFGCIPALSSVRFVPFLVLALGAAAAGAVSVLYAQALAKRLSAAAEE